MFDDCSTVNWLFRSCSHVFEGMCCWLGAGDIDVGGEPWQSALGGGGGGARGCWHERGVGAEVSWAGHAG